MVSTAINPATLETEAFLQKVIEERLEVVGPLEGYLWAMEPGSKGKVLFRTASGPWDIGQLTHNTIAQPAVATNPATTAFAAAGFQTKLEYVYHTLTCDANVATRLVYMQLTEGTNVVFIAPLYSATAGQTVYVTYAPGLPYDNSTTRKVLPMPEFSWTPGSQISWASTAIQVGDQFSITRYGTRSIPIP